MSRRADGGSDERVGTDSIAVSDHDVAYLVGKGGSTRTRLERYSGSRLSVNQGTAEVTGTPAERDRAKLAIDITLQQRNGGRISLDFDELERRSDVAMHDVPTAAVGFMLGAKGQTLRALESKHCTFMFFDNEHFHHNNMGETKRLYILGTPVSRASSLEEVKEMLASKLGRPPPPPPRHSGGPPLSGRHGRHDSLPPPPPRGYDGDDARGRWAGRSESREGSLSRGGGTRRDFRDDLDGGGRRNVRDRDFSRGDSNRDRDRDYDRGRNRRVYEREDRYERGRYDRDRCDRGRDGQY
jgi:hypothetical protein